MPIDQADLLWGMDMLFVREFMGISASVHFEKGDVVFREGDPADYFYTLIEGKVRLSIGEPPKEVYKSVRPRTVESRATMPTRIVTESMM